MRLDLKMADSSYRATIEKIVQHYIRERRFSFEDKKVLIDTIESKLTKKLSSNRNKAYRSDKEKIEYYIYAFCNDLEDLKLLEDNSPQIIEKYKAQVSSITRELLEKSQIDSKYYPYVFEEVIAALNLKLLRGKLNQFREDSLFRTFFYMVAKNVVRDEIRKIKRQEREVELNPAIAASAQDRNAIGGNAERLGLLLTMLMPKAERLKFEFCSKVIYRLPISAEDLAYFFPNSSKDQKQKVVSLFGAQYALMQKGDMWNHLKDCIEMMEGKKQGLTKLKHFVEGKKLIILETILERSIIEANLSRDAKNEMDHYFERLIHQYYENSDVEK